ncbi:MAG: S8 family peptidase [Thermoflexibacter sp.]|jgi:subtilisin|nr:S8 family peptidase [Thermoflexibacter sp.]
MANKKRYIVTYKTTNINMEEISNILNTPEINIQDGVAFLMTDKLLSESDVHHFHGIGSSSIVLTEKEASKIQNDNRVLELIEDIDVFAMDEEENIDDFYSQIYIQMYNLAYQDVLKKMTKYVEEEQKSTDLRPPFPIPPNPFPYFPNRPIWPPIHFPPFLRQPIPWNITNIKANQVWQKCDSGRDIKVAILDTGISNHPDIIIKGGVSFVPGIISYGDGNGHGTHCAGIVGARNNSTGVVGVAPMSSIYAVKVLSDSGSGQLSWILAGLSWALQNKMDVVSMSLGSSGARGPIAAYTSAIEQLLSAGIVVVAAAGNSYGTVPPNESGYVSCPANSPGVIAVGAVDKNNLIGYFSSRGGTGNQVTISAPGVSINSTYLNNGYKELTGTSMACPHVAGVVALIKKRFPSLTPSQIIQKIRMTAQDLGVPGNDITYGAGLIDANAVTI